MKLTLKNIGLIINSEIDLNGITVIGGDNNTGKSTVGKALFAVLDGLNGLDRRLKIEVYERIRRALNRGFSAETFTLNIRNVETILANEIEKKSDFFVENTDMLRKRIEDFYSENCSSIPIEEVEAISQSITDEITNVLKISKTELYKVSFTRSLFAEFHQQLGDINLPYESCIVFEDGNFFFKICWKDNFVKDIFPENDIYYEGNVVYLDDPFLLDHLPFGGRIHRFYNHNHQEQLINNLIKDDHEVSLVDDVVMNSKLAEVSSMLSKACEGTIVKGKLHDYSYRTKDGKNLYLGNVSTGLKTFISLKTLLLNGSLSTGDTIILDEPEVHLHPKWQLLFAEIIVLLQKQLNMRILLNTHSPYFLRAIQVYSAKHEIADRCTYYLSELEDGHAVIRDTTDNVEAIYAKLAEPFQQLEDARWQDD